MTEQPAYRYAIVRFRPFVETGEFANVGVVAVSAEAPEFAFKLMRRRYRRVTEFFEDLEGRVFKTVMRGLEGELKRLQALAQQKTQGDAVMQLFNEAVRPRESMIRFSEPGVVLAPNARQATEQLFAHYVERSFHTKQRRQAMLEQTVRHWLNEADLGGRFKEDRIGDEIFQVRFPFVARTASHVDRVIKPLHLGQDESSQILEQGGRWCFRLNELQKRNRLPQHVLFAIEGPEANDRRGEAFANAVDELLQTGVDVVQYSEQNLILDFAQGCERAGKQGTASH